MTGKVTIQWCPSCQAWNRSKRVQVDVLQGIAAGGELGPISFDYRRESRSCESCNGDFVTTSLENCDPAHRWHVQTELGNIRRSRAAETQAGDFQRDSHPELADFSIAVAAG